MTPETPQAGKRGTAKAGNKAGGGASSTGAPESTMDQTTGTGTESVNASATAAPDSNLGSTNGDAQSAGRGLLNQVREKAASQINQQKDRPEIGQCGAHAFSRSISRQPMSRR